MNLHQILQTVPPEYHAIARHYVRQFELAGVPEDKIDRLIQWGVSYQGSNEEADLLAAFRAQASRLGLDDVTTATAADLGLEAREQINSGKWQPEPVALDETAQILADIRRYRQQWPGDYSQDKDMQAAELRLIDIQLGNAPAPVVAPKSEPGKLVVQPGSRMAEIRQIMRDDPDRYNADRALQNEQLALIEAEIASRPAETSQVSGDAVSSPAEGA